MREGGSECICERERENVCVYLCIVYMCVCIHVCVWEREREERERDEPGLLCKGWHFFPLVMLFLMAIYSTICEVFCGSSVQQQHPFTAGQSMHCVQQERFPRCTGLLQESSEDQPQVSSVCPSGHGSLLCQAQPPAQSKVRVCLGVGHCFVKLDHLPSYLGMNHCLVKLNFLLRAKQGPVLAWITALSDSAACPQQGQGLSGHGSLLCQVHLCARSKVRVCLDMSHCFVKFTSFVQVLVWMLCLA